MNRPVALDRLHRRSPAADLPPLPHLLACEACARRMSEKARESNPGMRVDLFPGEECLRDETLAHLARARQRSSDWDHLGQCLWCALSVRHFETQPTPIYASKPRPAYLDRRTSRIDGRLAPSAELRRQRDSLSVKSPLARVAHILPFSPDLPSNMLILNVVAHQQLPVTAPDGTPMNYFLEWREGGRLLEENETLLQAGVKEGDHVHLVPKIGP